MSLPDDKPVGEQRKQQAEEDKLSALRKAIREKLASRYTNMIVVRPAPRYDRVFEQGVKWLDSL